MFNVLRSLNDPIRAMQRRTKATWIIGVVVTTVCAAWYVWPLGDDDGNLSLPMTGDALTDDLVEPPGAPGVDREAYAAVNLWNPPPPPEVEVNKTDDKPARREIPRRLRLVAILKAAGTPGTSGGPGSPQAAIHDPDTDTVLIVGEGDRINGHFLVKQITPSGVELFDGRDIRVLELEDKPK